MFLKPDDVVRKAADDIWTKRSFDAFERWHAPNFQNHTAPLGMDASLGSFKQAQTQFLNAFSDAHIHIFQQIVEGDRVASHFRMRGAHTGIFLGMTPSGKQVDVSGMRMDRVEADRISEHWVVLDLLSLLRQISPPA